jgi:hypothetical protein
MALLDRKNIRMSMGTAHDDRLEHPGDADIGQEPSLSTEQLVVFFAA